MARWLTVLDAFVDRDEWGVRELAAARGLSTSAAHRILHEMKRLGLLTTEAEGGHFRIGPELARIAVLVANRLDVTRIGRPVLAAAAAEIGETVILALYSPTRHQFWAVDAAESSHTIRYIWESLRTWTDLHVGSSGKGILAFLPEIEREAIIAALPDQIPGLRPISKTALRAELEEARRRGYVISHGERIVGAVGVAAPIRDANGEVLGDLIASWPDNRTDPKKEAVVTDVIVRAAGNLSRQLGYRSHEGAHEDELAESKVRGKAHIGSAGLAESKVRGKAHIGSAGWARAADHRNDGAGSRSDPAPSTPSRAPRS